MWSGKSIHLLEQLVLKDFKIRYRNMSLGVFWSLINPLILMVLWTYVFKKIFHNPNPHFNIYVLSGIITFNFFTISWASATNSLVDNASLIKKLPIRREVLPVAAALSNLTHLLIQFAMLVVFVLWEGLGINRHWLWLPLLWGMELAFIIGLGLITSALNVFLRDIRYVVESTNVILFWLVPIVYTFGMVPPEAKDLYQYNPVAALILATHNVILEHRPPSPVLLTKMASVAAASLIAGVLFFRRVSPRFYEHI